MWHRLPERCWTGVVLLWMTAGWCASAMAAPTDAAIEQLPYEIQADSAVFDQVKGTGEYRGHVLLQRGPEQLKATRMTIYLDARKQLSRVEATGSPVTFTDGVDMSGHAAKLTYSLSGKSLMLSGAAYVKQGEREFSGVEITYALDSKKVQAKGGDGQRVRLVLPPADTQGSTRSVGAPAVQEKHK